jgi:hypothetical protein
LERGLALKWDHSLGAVEFRFARKLDMGRWCTWVKVRDSDWPAGTVTLNERDGRIYAGISYKRPVAATELDPARQLDLHLSETGDALILAGPDREQTFERLTLANALAQVDRTKAESLRWEERRAAAGSPRRPWGFRRAWKGAQAHLKQVTRRRARLVADWNHAWTRRVAGRVRNWRCGSVLWRQPADGLLAGRPWNWTQFTADLRYKLAEMACSLATE